MVENVGHRETGNSRRIKHRADCDCMMRRIIVPQAPPTWPHPPSQTADFYLAVEVPMVEIFIEFRQRVILARGGTNPFASSLQAALSYRFFHFWILSEPRIFGSYFLRRASAYHLASQYQHDRLKYILGCLAAMVANTHNPARSLAADCVGQSNIRIKGSTDFRATERWKAGLHHVATDSLQVSGILLRTEISCLRLHITNRHT